MLCVLLICSAAVAQAQKLHAVYEYIPSAMASFREHVYVDNLLKIAVRDSVAIGAQDKNKNEVEDEEFSNLSIVVDKGVNYRRIVIQKNGERTLTETRTLKGVNYLVSDEFPELVWNTDYTETDSLGSFLCHKATAEYRGTKLIAYYTDKIPVPAGPSKFGGLPGLIVMLYNESANPNYWMLKNVSYPYEGSVPVSMSYISNLPKLSLKEFIQKDDAWISEQMRFMESKMPVIEGAIVEQKRARGTVEQVYEWESKK